LRSANRQFASPDYYIYFCGFRAICPAKSTGVNSSEAKTGLPSAYALEQNYPNPFNPSTTIPFSLPDAAPVSIRVYNTLGEMVAIVAKNQLFAAGEHTLHFSAVGLSAGIYFYRLEAAGSVQIRKMTLLQ